MDKTRVVAIVLVAMLAVLLSGCAQPQNEEKVKMRVVYLPAVQSMPLFVAIEQNRFAEAGLDVEAVRMDAPNQIIDALISGKADAGAPSVASGIVALADTKNPDVLKIYAMSCGTPGVLNDELLVAKNSSITGIGDLEGKKIGMISGIQFKTVANRILEANGVSPADVTYVEIAAPNQLPALASGSIDAVLTLEPIGTVGGQKGISRVLVDNPMARYVSDPWCGGAGVVSTGFMDKHPEEAAEFIRIIKEADAEMRGNQSTRQYMVKYLSLTPEAAQQVPYAMFLDSAAMNAAQVGAYQKFADEFYMQNATDRRPDVRKLLLGQGGG